MSLTFTVYTYTPILHTYLPVLKMMASQKQQVTDQLTTDAVPSPNHTTSENVGERNNIPYDAQGDKMGQFEDKIRANVDNCPGSGKSKHTIHKVHPMPGAQATIININNSKDIHVGDTIHYNINSPMESKVKNTFVETGAINALKSSNQPISRDDLFLISGYVDERWKDVARSLDYTDPEIKQFWIDHQTYGIKEVIYQLLLDWKQNQPQKASVGLLARAMFDNNQGDALRKWSEKMGY